MISASNKFKQKLKSGGYVVNYADITLSDGTVLHLEPKDFMIGGCTIEDKTTDGKFGVGFTVGKTLQIKIANHNEQFSQYDFFYSTINLYVAMKLDDGAIEKVRKGVYYATVPSTSGDIIEISAVDGMFKLDKDYSGSTTVYPATLQQIVSDACLDCGIPIGFTQFANMDYVVSEKPSSGTYRQIISYACQIAGYNARIDNNGYMQLVWYKTSLMDGYHYNGGNFNTYPHETILYGGNFKNYSTGTIVSGGRFTDDMPINIFRIKTLDVHTDDVRITGVRVVGDNEVSYLSGVEGYVIEIKGNPFATGKEQQVANYLAARIVGLAFRPFSAEVLSNPLYEPFEIVKVSDRKGNLYYSIVNSVSYTVGAYTQISCEAEDPIRNGSTYSSGEAAKAVAEARKEAQKQISNYDKAVQGINQLAANAMGLFLEKEVQSDGSTISYESTRPITVDANGKCHFAAGSTVYKRTGDGFFVSNDGGQSFTSGFDQQGNAVLNVLNAIGINADWINSGTITGRTINGGTINGSDVNGVKFRGGSIVIYKEVDGIKNEIFVANENGIGFGVRAETIQYLFGNGFIDMYGETRLHGDIVNYTSQGKKSLLMGRNTIRCYNWGSDEKQVGAFGVSRSETSSHMTMWCEKGYHVSIGYREEEGGQVRNVMTFDSNKPNDPPSIANTVSGNLISGGELVTVKNGFITGIATSSTWSGDITIPVGDSTIYLTFKRGSLVSAYTS